MGTAEIKTSKAVSAIERLKGPSAGQLGPEIYLSKIQAVVWEPLRTGPTGEATAVRSKYISNGGLREKLGIQVELLALREGAAQLSDDKSGVDFVRLAQSSRFPGINGPVLTFGSAAERVNIVYSGPNPEIVETERTDAGFKYNLKPADSESLAVADTILKNIQRI